MRIRFGLFMCVWLLQACSSGEEKHSEPHNANNASHESEQSVTRLTLDGHHYVIGLPEAGLNPHKAYKLLLAFHGSGQSEVGMQSMTRFETFSDEYIVVYPKSKEVEWDEGCGCNIAARLKANDVNFVVKLIEKMHQEYNLLEGENYAVGYSQGALFSQNMLCKHSALFKAVASVGAPMSEQLSISCKITEPTHYLQIHGTADQVLPYDGMYDDNFPLISSPRAIELIAAQNKLNPDYTDIELSKSVKARVYQSEAGIHNSLVSIQSGGHQWAFSEYDTSREVLSFFSQHSQYPFAEGSALYTLDGQNYHVRTLGNENAAGDIVILPGANKFFHSDSAWAALIQPLLAQHSRVHVIDRLGSAWSSMTDTPSLARFAADLPSLLTLLEIEKVTFLAFANANLTTLMYLADPNPDVFVNGLVWADPDILTAHSVELYQSGSVAELRAYPALFIEHVDAGNWTEKTMQRLAIERAEIAALIPANYQSNMDWAYYDLVSQQRLEVEKQVTRIKEMMSYHDDLNTASVLESAITVPVSIIDGDFESHDIDLAHEDEKSALIKWQQEGVAWSKAIAYKTGGIYYPLNNASHQLFFEHPDTVIEAVLAIHQDQ
ncbi:alpha/beta hydrolase [Pseudoalteromonas luteoviolacea]|uniref:alpha/beta hydrolase n=1 Tax=Pseudoalteromonas luteoviolacea TaxID=43657 RepID=UPI001B372326|nr:alpha/beta hydrolase [Pseudoalteromonas luteoviolacea]MBQ4838162.1 alpha/beta hydrolase [Pseudoalteromonas luteoviolacea]